MDSETASPGTNSELQESVLLVPPRLCQSAYALLVRTNCTPRPWHLQGRYGSRTRRSVDQERMALPILYDTCEELLEHADDELRDLLTGTEGVEVVQEPFVPSNRAQDLPAVDARIHAELAPAGNDDTSASCVPIQQEQQETAGSSSTEQPCHKRAKIEAPTSAPPSFTYAEMFAGIGGFGVALDALGGNCVFCSELEPACRAVYAQNNAIRSANLHGDIYKVPDDAIPSKGSVDLLVGGFPCQPFSSLGQQPGLEDPKGSLFLQIVRFLNLAQPQAFLLENVPGLLQMTETFQTIVTALEETGYHVTTEVCNARGLTATNRKRLFFVGLRKYSNGDDMPSFEFPYIPDLSLRAIDVVDYSNSEIPKVEWDLITLTDTQLTQLAEGNRKWKPGASMAWPNVVCDTLIAHYGNAVGRGGSQLVPMAAPGNPRRFSPRECARIMGFPNTFQLVGAMKISETTSDQRQQGDMARIKEQYRMVGNAVCPPLIAALASAVLEHCREIKGYTNHEDWVIWGRETAVRIALSATITHQCDGGGKKQISAASVPSSFAQHRKLELIR
jgi:DNA (cytosine-5)-methyltransferase 1